MLPGNKLTSFDPLRRKQNDYKRKRKKRYPWFPFFSFSDSISLLAHVLSCLKQLRDSRKYNFLSSDRGDVYFLKVDTARGRHVRNQLLICPRIMMNVADGPGERKEDEAERDLDDAHQGRVKTSSSRRCSLQQSSRGLHFARCVFLLVFFFALCFVTFLLMYLAIVFSFLLFFSSNDPFVLRLPLPKRDNYFRPMRTRKSWGSCLTCWAYRVTGKSIFCVCLFLCKGWA